MPSEPGFMRGVKAAVRAALGTIGATTLLALVEPPHTSREVPPGTSAALVLSGDVDYLRLERSIRLLREGTIGWLVLTGVGVGGDSADTMRRLAIDSGVPAERILVEPRATSTRENLEFTAPMIRAHGFESVALVTNASHMGRAERVARKVLPEVSWIPVVVPDPGPRSRIYKTRLQEWVKLIWYALRGWI